MNVRHAVVAALLTCSLPAAQSLAQSVDTAGTPATTARWSLLVPSGTIVPTGAQRQTLGRGNVTALQVAYALQPTFALVTTFGWARTRDIATAGNPKLDVFTYDVGAETRAPRWLEGKGMALTPFAGAGVGGRSYNYRKLPLNATHDLAAYVGAGGELRVRRVAVRLEARDYLTQFKALNGGDASRAGNDVVVMAGLRLFSR